MKTIKIIMILILLALAFTACESPTEPVSKAPVDITYTVYQTGGTNGEIDSTGIVFTFSASVDRFKLSAADITVGTAAVKGSGVLTGSGTSWTLSPITLNAGGTATVVIAKTGIEAGTKYVTVFKAGQFISSHVHQWSEYEIIAAATCTTAGEKTATCTRTDCDETDTQIIPIDPDAHGWSDWVGTVTCIQAGEGTRVCAFNSEHTETKELDALGHNWGEYATTSAPTCTTEGEETATCTRTGCDETDTQAIPIDPDAHKWSDWVGTASCDTAGTGTRTCSYNPAHTDTQDLPALGHNYITYLRMSNPTCTTGGMDTAVCSRNSTHPTDTRLIAALGHEWGDWLETTATCTTAGEESRTCSRETAHKETRPVAALGHDSGAWHVTLAPTCTEAGKRELRCTRDAYVLNTDTPAALGHDFSNWEQTTAPTCTTAGEDTRTCSRDSSTETRVGAAIVPDAHDWNTTYTTVTAANATTNGTEAITCKHNTAHTKEPRTLWATGTAELTFTAIGSGTNTAYRVSRGSATGAIHIPAYWRAGSTNYADYRPVTEIGNGNDTMGNNAFGATSGGSTLTSLTFAENSQLTTISAYAFYNCSSLTGNITLPSSLKSISASAFLNCASITSITIPASVTTVGTSVFQNWTNTQTINVPFANATARPSGWVTNWNSGNAVVKYWNGSSYQ